MRLITRGPPASLPLQESGESTMAPMPGRRRAAPNPQVDREIDAYDQKPKDDV